MAWSLGLDKCSKVTIKHGKLETTENVCLDDEIEIRNLDQDDKYLGIDESDGIQQNEMKEKIRKEYLRRLRLILGTCRLSGDETMLNMNNRVISDASA